MLFSKESILDRRPKGYHSQRDQTSVALTFNDLNVQDKDYEAEQRKFELKKNRYNEAMELRKTALFGTLGEKKAIKYLLLLSDIKYLQKANCNELL